MSRLRQGQRVSRPRQGQDEIGGLFYLIGTVAFAIPLSAIYFGAAAASWIQVSLLFANVSVVGLYTFYARRLWEAAQRQNELHIQPFVVLRIKSSQTRPHFEVENVGNGTAIGVGIEEFRLVYSDLEREYLLRFNSIQVLKAGEKKQLVEHTFRLQEGEEVELSESEEFITPWLDARYQNDSEVPLVVTYKDIQGKPIKTTVIAGSGEMRVEIG